MNRITKDPEERRKEIIATARNLFFTNGYEETSVSDIVKAIGVAQGTFYYYFESKQDVLEAITVELVDEQRAGIVAIVRDESLNAISKWKQAIMASSDWKIGRKEAMLELVRTANILENSRLRERFRRLSREKVTTLFKEIINQGIAEGVFQTDYPEETADIVIAISKSLKDVLMDILTHPDNYADPKEIAKQKLQAVEAAMERVLAAPVGSMEIISDEMLEDWFGT